MTTFRVHFTLADGKKVHYDHSASTSEAAAAFVRKRFPGCIILKIKAMKGK